jgi:hypothetical protein
MLAVRKSQIAKVSALLLILIAAALCAGLLSVIVNDNDTITDARNYYYFYNMFLSDDLLEFSATLTQETGKFEPAIYVLVYSSFEWFIKGFQSFAFACMFLVLAGLAIFTYATLKRLPISLDKVYLSVIFSVFIYTVWYPSYSSVLWVWRSHLAFTLVFFAIINTRILWCVCLICFSFFLHYSSVPLAMVVCFFFTWVRFFPKISLGVKFLGSLSIGLVASMLVGVMKSAVVSGDGVWVSDTDAGAFVYAYFSCFVVSLVAIFSQADALKMELSGCERKLLAKLFCVILFFLGLSITSVKSHQDLMRIMQPAFIIAPLAYIIIFIRSKMWPRFALFGLLLPGIVMGVRSGYIYLGGV